MVATEPWQAAVETVVAGCPQIRAADAIAFVRSAIADGAPVAHAADLALAWSVGRGDPVAARRFDEHVGSEILAAARAIDRDPSFVDEVAQRTRIRLIVGEGEAAPRVTSYRGTGPLRAWVAITAQRVALNAKRDAKTAAGAPHAGDDVLADLVDREPDPELRHLKGLYRAEFREALVSALAGLSDRFRAVLRLRFVEALELAQIGRLYRVHESTASRWVSAALDEIACAARSQLVSRLSITSETADSVARMVHSQLDLSIARLLR